MTSFFALLIELLGSIVGRILIALGIGFFTYTGLDFVFGFIQQQFLASASGIPGYAAGFLGILRIGTCFNILMSAITIRMTLSGVKDGASMRKMGQK